MFIQFNKLTSISSLILALSFCSIFLSFSMVSTKEINTTLMYESDGCDFKILSDTIEPSGILLQERMPRYPGCEAEFDEDIKKACAQEKMLEYIYTNIKYPEKAKKKKLKGTVVIRFIVTETGEITNAAVVRDIGGGCGEEALRVVKSMPTWIPGIQNGNYIKVQFNMPI